MKRKSTVYLKFIIAYLVFAVLSLLTINTVTIIRYIRLNMEKAADSMRHLSNGEFVKVDEKGLGQDEIAQIIHAANHLSDTLQGIIGNMMNPYNTR